MLIYSRNQLTVRVITEQQLNGGRKIKTAKRILALGALISILIVSFASPAISATIIGNDEVTLSKNITDDVYVFGGNINVVGDIHGDLVIAGGNISVTGDVDGDLMIAGGQITVDGRVGDTVRIGGGSVTINGPVAKDVLVGAGDVTLGPKSIVGGDLLAGAGNLSAKGTIKDDILGGIETAKITGEVGGNVKVSAESLALGNRARIGGNLTYKSSNPAKIAKGAKIGGEIRQKRPKKAGTSPAVMQFLNWGRSLIGMILVALMIAWLFPQTLAATSRALTEKPGASVGLGLATLIVTPFAAIILAAATIGLALPIAIIAMLFYALGLYLAQIYVAATIGALILKKISGKDRWVGAGAIVGVILVSVLRLVPIVSTLIGLALIIFGLGAMSVACWEAWRTGRSPKATVEQE